MNQVSYNIHGRTYTDGKFSDLLVDARRKKWRKNEKVSCKIKGKGYNANHEIMQLLVIRI